MKKGQTKKSSSEDAFKGRETIESPAKKIVGVASFDESDNLESVS